MSPMPKIQILIMPHVRVMAEFMCPDCGQRFFHENETALEIQKNVHKKFCTKNPGDMKSYIHRGLNENEPIDAERATDNSGNPILKR